jgi:early secretory antigenic target protein ESAT-6
MPTSEIKVTFSALAAAQADVATTASRITAQLEDLKRFLAPMVATWQGRAAEDYQVRQRQWDAAASDIAAGCRERRVPAGGARQRGPLEVASAGDRAGASGSWRGRFDPAPDRRVPSFFDSAAGGNPQLVVASRVAAIRTGSARLTVGLELDALRTHRTRGKFPGGFAALGEHTTLTR